MSRTVSYDLSVQLAEPDCISHTTLDLYLADSSQIHVATAAFTIDSRTYTADLRKAGELKQSISSPPNRVNVTIQNVDKVFGEIVTDEDLVKATAVVGRYYADDDATNPAEWVELFRGEARPIGLDENEVTLEVLHDLVAAGYCIADASLAENCQWVYKHAGTCGFAGAAATCNKKRRSLDGCEGKIVSGTTTNEYRFGGMEFPDIQTATTPLGGDDGSGGGGYEDPYCPRLDQYVLVKGEGAYPEPLLVVDLTDQHMLYNPITRTFHYIRDLRIVKDQCIWQLSAANGVESYSSGTHRVLPYREHLTGERVCDLMPTDPLLTWADGLADSTIHTVCNTWEDADVMKIEMEDGHIYCAGDTDEGFVVCHNSKPPPDYPTY